MWVSTGHKSKWSNKEASDCVGSVIFVSYFIALAGNLRTILNKGENRSPYLVINFNRNTFMLIIDLTSYYLSYLKTYVNASYQEDKEIHMIISMAVEKPYENI